MAQPRATSMVQARAARRTKAGPKTAAAEAMSPADSNASVTPQLAFLIAPATISNSLLIIASLIISGGESAMVSPVTRIIAPAS